MFKVGEKEKMMLIRDMKRNSELETLSRENPQTPPFLSRQHRSPITRLSLLPQVPSLTSFLHLRRVHHLKTDNNNDNPIFIIMDSGWILHEESTGMILLKGGDPSAIQMVWALVFGDVSSYNAGKYSSYEGFNEGFQSSPQQISVCFDGNDVMSKFLCFDGNDAMRSTFPGFHGGNEKGDSLWSYGIGYNQSNDLVSKSSWHNNQRMEQGRSFDNGESYYRMPFAKPYLDSPFVRSQHCGRMVPLLENHSVIIQGRDLKHGVDNSGHDSFKCFDGNDVMRSTLLGLHGETKRNAFSARPYLENPFELCSQQCGMDGNGGRGVINSLSSPRSLHSKVPLVEDHSVIIQERDLKYGFDNLGHDTLKCHKKNLPKGLQCKTLERKTLDLTEIMEKSCWMCTEEQRLQIVLMVTKEAGQLVRISLNTYGTRVVQKLIETLKYRQQISRIISALKPGILDLIKDLNGNHVLQRCLQCLDNEDNKADTSLPGTGLITGIAYYTTA
ncbi:hypothetical protein F3Y22_tig00117005pilonHSYRG00342 [Hibiscus syriacus]|uniref:PUM-HD domain-containing protein n=1 Tax=Hibiscus syriacus TaxID=106335 RepID=A0A6A2XIN4_HIBSY|nr:hypothetical protein F3Y22_tig00117005pilonHSYRG00342 [Hibiscus syriacus]